MKRPVESDYTSHVAYARALEEYCDSLPQLAQEPKPHECTYGYSDCRALAIANAALAQPAPVPPAWFPAVENILNEYGLQAIDFVADFKAAMKDAEQSQRTWVGSGDLEDSNAYQTPHAQPAPDCKQTGICVASGLACFGQPAQEPVEKVDANDEDYWDNVFGMARADEQELTPVQEPVACVQDLDEVKRKHLVYEKGMDWKDPLYTTAARRKPLPYGELMALAKNSDLGPERVSGLLRERLEIYGRAIEAAHGIKENT
jgi:hypothetical protein